jgi:pyruvate,orthophosphate dikinase
MRMAACGLPVPPAFVLATDVCRSYLQHGAVGIAGLSEIISRELEQLGALTNSEFGDGRRPLLVSVRSGAAISMPGMMETVLNVGLNRTTLHGLMRTTGNPRLAADCRRRFVQQYGEVVEGITPAVFVRTETECLKLEGARSIDELDTAGLNHLAEAFERVFEAECGHRLPTDPLHQITAAVEAVLKSWSSDRAKTYRQMNGISEALGTAVIVQAMVFGNLGPSSGSGVGFTRNPANGCNELYVDYLANAQGEDVVGGRRTAGSLQDLAQRAPEAHAALVKARDLIEREFGDMQDFEFTVERGRLLMLQSRVGKRTPLAALRIANDLVMEDLITPHEALARLSEIVVDEIGEDRLRLHKAETPIARGTSAGSGVAVGSAVFDISRVQALRESGQPVILVRETAETGEIEALAAAAAIVTVQGARTSHAAVVARQLGKPCVVGCGSIVIDPSLRAASATGHKINEGDVIAVDGSTGEIFSGPHDVIRDRPADLLKRVQAWREADGPVGTAKRSLRRR